ncbi:MAG TPA: galactose-1-epimerase, partial [Flavisolibacter sp.]|nr:galactose-1-epimerase [Flavisolibacter sp.]
MKNITFALRTVLAAVLLLSYSCNNNSGNAGQQPSNDTTKSNTTMIPDKANFQATIDGKKTDLYILKNKNGMTAAITNYGGRLVSLIVPDKKGKMTDVAVGLKSVKDYEAPTDAYYGATIGRFGNRIAN